MVVATVLAISSVSALSTRPPNTSKTLNMYAHKKLNNLGRVAKIDSVLVLIDPHMSKSALKEAAYIYKAAQLKETNRSNHICDDCETAKITRRVRSLWNRPPVGCAHSICRLVAAGLAFGKRERNIF